MDIRGLPAYYGSDVCVESLVHLDSGSSNEENQHIREKKVVGDEIIGSSNEGWVDRQHWEYKKVGVHLNQLPHQLPHAVADILFLLYNNIPVFANFQKIYTCLYQFLQNLHLFCPNTFTTIVININIYATNRIQIE